MNNPYALQCGHIFDKKNIELCLKKKSCCPLCNKPAKQKDLVPIYLFKNIISKINEQRKKPLNNN